MVVRQGQGGVHWRWGDELGTWRGRGREGGTFGHSLKTRKKEEREKGKKEWADKIEKKLKLWREASTKDK